MASRSKRFVLTFIFTALLPTAVVAGGVFLIDPYQHFRASDLYPAGHKDQIRYLAPGIARHRSYELVILGDSLSQNFLPSVARQAFGSPAVNLSLNGSSAYEQRAIAEVAFRTGQVRQVIWGLNYNAFRGPPKWSRIGPDFPLYLYDDNRLNDIRYLFNLGVLQSALDILRDPQAARDSPDLFNTWYRDPDRAPGRDKVLKVFESARPPRDPAYTYRNFVANLEHNVLPVVRAHRETRFIFFVPPYSFLHYVARKHYTPQIYTDVLRFYHTAFTTLVREPNVTVHYFDANQRLTHNLDHYNDLDHYSLEISSQLRHAMAQDQTVMTAETIAPLLGEFDRRIRTVEAQTRK